MGDRTFRMRIESPSGATFVVTPAKPLWTSPNPSVQPREATVRRLAIRFAGATEGTVTVRMRSVSPGGPGLTEPNVVPLAQWKTGPKEVAKLDWLSGLYRLITQPLMNADTPTAAISARAVPAHMISGRRFISLP